MIALAIGFLEAYFDLKAGMLVDKAAHKATEVFDKKLGEFYGWVHQKVTGKPSAERALRMFAELPGGKDQQDTFSEELEGAIGGDPQAQQQLNAMITELKRLRPAGVTIRGLAEASVVAGEQAGVDIEGTLAAGDSVTGQAIAGSIEPGGKQAGVVYRPGG
jgi:hypothetical protein